MNRRITLRIFAMAMMGLAFPRARVAAETGDPESVMAALSTYMSGAAGRALPAEFVEYAKHHIVDTLAAMISGSELRPGQAALRYVRARGGKGTATIAGSNLTVRAGPRSKWIRWSASSCGWRRRSLQSLTIATFPTFASSI